MLLTEEQKRKQRAERNRQVASSYRLTPRGGSAPAARPAAAKRRSPLAPLRPGEFADVVPLAHARTTKRYKQRTGA